MKTINRNNTVLTLAVLLFLWTVQTTSAFYAPNLQRWVNRDPIEEGAGPNLYRFVANDPKGAFDAFGLWELRCRLVDTIGPVTGDLHCWVECNGHSYSLLNKGGTATKVTDDPVDRGKGTVIASGSRPNDCYCIEGVFNDNKATHTPYSPLSCNSNHFAYQLLSCCGASVTMPSKATNWNICLDPSRAFDCSPPCILHP